jgi:putative transcriptional regulator
MTPEEIKHLRQVAGLSQEGFARELGISFATVNRWENNRAVPSRLAQRILEQFKKRTERLHAS